MNNDRNILTLFAGGGLFTEGAKNAGLTPAGAVELDNEKANIYRLNHGHDVTVRDVQLITEEDWKEYKNVWLLQASPPCKNSSRAKRHTAQERADGLEFDSELAAATIRAFKIIKPKFFVLENVTQYRLTPAFKSINTALEESGYTIWNSPINACDFGVPQNRERLILVAAREEGMMCRFEIGRYFERRKGWYQALERHVSSCKTKKLAPYQITAIRAAIEKGKIAPNDVALLVGGAGSDTRKPGVTKYDSQSPTVRACEGMRSGGWRPVIVMQSDFLKEEGEAIGYRLSSRCLLALQGVGDSFLPGTDIITCFVAGNGVAVPVATAICTELIRIEREHDRHAKKTADGGN